MLNWLKRKLRKWLEVETSTSATIPTKEKTKALPEDCDLYQPEERLIFTYFDGSTTLMKADPMVLYRRVMDIAPSLSVDISVARSQHKDADKAYLSMLDHIRKVFGVKKFEEGGLTEPETVALFDKFNAYCEEVQKKTKNLATSPTATSPTSQPFIPGGPTISPTSASGSTVNAPSSAVPQQSSTA